MANAPEENIIISSGRGQDEDQLSNFAELYKAVRDGKLTDTVRILDQSQDFDQPGDKACNKIITDRDETALHVAVLNGHEHIVEELMNRMSDESLAMYDRDGYTALITAAVLGNRKMVECMLTKKSDLIRIKSNSNGKNLPVVMAIDFGQIEMARYLYDLTPEGDLIPQDNDQEITPDEDLIPQEDNDQEITPDEDLIPQDNDQEIHKDHNGATLLTCAIYAGTLDGMHIALGLIERCPRLALAIDKYDESGILALASMRQSLPSGNQRIYSSNVEHGQSNQEESNRSDLEHGQSNQEESNRSNVEHGQSNQEESNRSDLEHGQSNQEGINISEVEHGQSSQEEINISEHGQSNQEEINISDVEHGQSNHEEINRSDLEHGQSNQEGINISGIMRIPILAPAICKTRSNISEVEHGQSSQEEINISEHGQSNQEEINKSDVEHGQSNHEEINRSGITQLYEMKRIHDQYDKLLSKMCEEISESLQSNTQQLKDGLVYTAICQAAENGISEFVSKMLETDRHFLWTEDRNGRNIFMLGVLHRQEKIFSILYRLDGKIMNSLTCLQDRNKNNMLHMAGMMEDAIRQINQIPGAALQMQRELQWFKEVERIVLPRHKETKNGDGLTPRQLFTKNHEDMKEKGEKWMKNTARSCTVVGALIVTIMFAAIFTLPGDNNQSMGLPKSLNKFWLNVLIIFDALSLFSSSTSVLMFLGILTSRYSEEDFLEYLPRQMIIGLLTLFCSIATMMITFSSALLIILQEQLRIAIPLICLASVPVTFFVWIQFPILKDMIISTYGPSIFTGRK
ncbi:uncharacterized protein LOC109004069 isoform X6 [Juglans regia]|uniref:Uncharacterized protein LOC109004069 isoform X6 n=1 Tax=Juglans regia TaxID=51240 RepID=A0A6P9EKM4_JUGRE|nr:uncharacterized protein LOC109004069 isoform X6 [Juglans regia]